MKKITISLIYCFFVLTISTAFAQTATSLAQAETKPITASIATTEAPDYMEIIRKADFYRGGQIPGISWDLKVQNYAKGKLKNEITLAVEAASLEAHLYALATFLGPRKYKGQKLLVRDNNMWFAKPGLRQPIAISSRQRLSGSAANADIASANYFNDYKIAATEEGELDGQACWVFELEANDNLVSYPRIKYWVTKESHLGLQSEYYGKSKKLIKTATFEYENQIAYKSVNYDFISKVNIYDRINKEDKTILNLSNISFGTFNNAKFQKNQLLD